jgi:hypothetical protein
MIKNINKNLYQGNIADHQVMNLAKMEMHRGNIFLLYLGQALWAIRQSYEMVKEDA